MFQLLRVFSKRITLVLFLITCFVTDVLPVSLLLAQDSIGQPNWALPPLEHAISIRDSTSRQRVSLEKMIDDLSQAQVVFLGESHTDETTHRLQLAVYEQLLERTQNRAVLALEMFQRDVQHSLDDYLVGKLTETQFLEGARPWSNYHEAYRPLVELAKRSSAPVVAANFPSSLTRKIAFEGKEATKSLSAEQRQLLPSEFLPNSPEYWKRVDNAVRGHQGMISNGGDQQRLYSVQSLWDNAMGDACATALDKYPEHIVLHVNGGFHSAYWDGAVHQLRLRKPKVKVKTVAIVPSLNPSTTKLTGKPSADFVVYVEAQATNIDRGKRSVQIGRELEYLLHLPERTSEQSPMPLLIWLVNDGLTAKEGMAYCKQLFGESAAIAVIEPPYRIVGDDLMVGGRWYWPDTFSEDTSVLVDGIEKIWAYLLRHYQIDTDHVCLAGEGTGATVAALVAVHSDRMKHSAIAIHPSQYAKLKDIPLPLPEYFGDDPPPERSLEVIAGEHLREWWQSELEQYNSAGVTAQLRACPIESWKQEQQVTQALHISLGIAAPASTADSDPRYLLVEGNSLRAWHWGRLQAAWLTKSSDIVTVAVREIPENGESKQVQLGILPEVASQPDVLPRCPGPFGGTTVLVLQQEIERDQVEAWLDVEKNDPLAAASRFHRVRIATSSDERALPKVLEKLQRENRKNILIVPAVFYADLTWLRELHDSVREYDNELTLHWSPGLGDRQGVLAN